MKTGRGSFRSRALFFVTAPLWHSPAGSSRGRAGQARPPVDFRLGATINIRS
jgi:hypothetical protein